MSSPPKQEVRFTPTRDLPSTAAATTTSSSRIRTTSRRHDSCGSGHIIGSNRFNEVDFASSDGQQTPTSTRISRASSSDNLLGNHNNINGANTLNYNSTQTLNSHGNYSTISTTNYNNQSQYSSLVPRDRYKLVCIGFTILGITTLLPWNFFITATDYWMYKFRNTSIAYDPNEPHTIDRTPLQVFFESYLAIAANVPMLLSMLLNSLYGQRFSQKKRLYVSLSVMLAIFAATTVFTKIDTDDMQIVFFVVTLAMVTVISFFSAIFQAAIFGIVASFPNNCMHSMVNGQAAAGLLAVTIQIMSMANNTGPVMSGLWYFLASTIFLAFAIICYWFMDNDYSRYYLVKIPSEDQLSTSLSVNFIESKSEILVALEDCWQMAASVIGAFWASLAVFPGICVLVVPQTPNSSVFTGRFFIPLTTFVMFNFGDLTGRVLSSFIPFPKRKKNLLLILTIARAVLPMLILFCNVYPKYDTPTWFTSDFYFPIFISFTALTNGYVFSSAMIMASDSSQKSRLEMTGFIMATALAIGLTLGSVSSTILLRLI